MQHITGIPRNQMFFSNLEEHISPENPVRFIDAFVEHLSLTNMGFIVKTLKNQGRPSFDIKVFLKTYLYGYLNGLRSSRKLEKECIRNIELQWLLCGMAYIEEKTQEYLTELEQNDLQDTSINVVKVQEKIERLKKNKVAYELLQEKLQASGEPQISTTDEDARALLVQGVVVEVSYNIQAAVDNKHNLVVALTP